MLCPQCKNDVTGKWCVYCGAKLEESSAPEVHAPNDSFNPEHMINQNENIIDIYRDDVSSDSYDSNPEETHSPEEDVNPYNSYYDDQPNSDGKKTKVVAVLSICVAILLVIGFLLFKFVFFNSPENTDTPASKPVHIADSDADNSKVKSLTKKGEKYMDLGDYEAAEDVYFELSELTDDDETTTIYAVLYNYNRAIKKLDDGDYEAAERYYDKIPAEYVDYSISPDVDDLGDNILSATKASKLLEQVKAYIASGEYDAAGDEISLIDDAYLSDSDKAELKVLFEKLEEAEKQKAQEDEPASASGHGFLAKNDAETLIYTYCYYMVEAINNNNFSLVAPYIYADSAFYSKQADLVTSCKNQGITETLESLTLDTLTKISDTKWDAKVKESETITYADGTRKTKHFNWTYTIEYIDSQFYVTGIR